MASTNGISMLFCFQHSTIAGHKYDSACWSGELLLLNIKRNFKRGFTKGIIKWFTVTFVLYPQCNNLMSFVLQKPFQASAFFKFSLRILAFLFCLKSFCLFMLCNMMHGIIYLILQYALHKNKEVHTIRYVFMTLSSLYASKHIHI